MEFSCQHQALLQGITVVERAVSSRDTKPILTGILLEAGDNQLRLVGTDLEIGMECTVPAEVVTAGSVVLTGRVLGQIVRKLECEQVRYATGELGMSTLEGGSARFSLHALPADEFPALPSVSDGSFWRMRQKDMKRMIRQSIFAVGTDESRPYLTGVFVEVEEGELRMVATDVSRLAFRRGELLSGSESVRSALVPSRTMQEMARILGTDDTSEVESLIADGQAVFHVGQVTVVSRLIEGEFPDYRRAFPQEQPTRTLIKRSAFLAAVERAALIARHSVPPIITLTATQDHLAIASREPDVGQVYEEVPATLEGVPGEASYQAYFLAEALRAMDHDDLYMEMGEGLKQGSIRPVDDSDYLYVLMPVRVG